MTESLTTTASTPVRQLPTGPDWLNSQRQLAWDKFVALPSPRLEKSDLTKRGWEVGPLADKSLTLSEKTQALLGGMEDAPVVVVRNGHLVQVSGMDALAGQGVIVTDLETATEQHEKLVKPHLYSVVPADESKWTALNAALWTTGVFVYVPGHTQVDQPIHFIYEETEQGNGAFPRALIVAAEGSKVSYVESYLTVGERSTGTVHSAVLEVVALADAKVTAVSFTEFTKGPTNYSVRRASVGKDASVDWVVGDVGDGFTLAVVESLLKGTGSTSTTRIVGVGMGRQHMDMTASMIHSGRHSESDIVMQGVLEGRAVTSFRSLTQIIRGAAGASSEQRDRILMLSNQSRADAIPMLLIDENDVQRCGHAASVGQIDENQVYYLMSRGIPKSKAVRMIVWGYLQPIVEAIPTQSIREWVTRNIDRELGQ